MGFKSNDKFKIKRDQVGHGLVERCSEDQKITLKGEVWAFLEDIQTGEKEKINIGKNVITLNASVLVARLLKDSDETNGLLFLAVGTGAVGWNLQAPPAATNQQTQLEAELFRKTFESSNFVKTDGSGDVSAIPTNIVDYITTFDVGEAVGPLVEMGLFGGDATGVPNSGTLFNFRTFPVINKSSTSKLTFVWRITT